MKGVAWRGVARSRIVDSCFPYPYSLLKGAQQLPHLRMYEVIKLLAGVVMVGQVGVVWIYKLHLGAIPYPPPRRPPPVKRRRGSRPD
jgi:hypothetical protein